MSRLVFSIAGLFGLTLGSVGSLEAAGVLYAIQDDTRNLISIDPDTLAITTVGATGVADGDFGDLAYDEGSGVMYWIAGRSNNQLYTIDLNTGAATLVGSHGIGDLFALGHDGSDLYAQSTNQQVYTIDASSASPTLIGSNGIYPGGYDWNPNTSQLIYLEAGGGGIYEVSRGDGTATFLGAGDGINDNDIAYDADRGVYWAGDYNTNLYTYDAVTYSRTLVLSGIGDVASLEYVRAGVIPEPASLLLCLPVVAAAGVRVLRRRRAA